MDKIKYIIILLIIIFFILNLFVLENRIKKNRISFENINQKENKKNYIIMKLKITAYNSEVNQTDADPFVGAWNNKVRKGMIAVSRDLEIIGLTNGVPIIFGGKKYIILDKMGKTKTIKGKKIKIEKTLDIWMESVEMARKWGIKYLDVKVSLDYIDLYKLFKNNNINIY